MTTTKTASGKPAQGAATQTQNNKTGHAEVKTAEKLAPLNIDLKEEPKKELVPLKKKMTVAEKIDAMKKLERMTLRLGHLNKIKDDLEAFAQGPGELDGASLYLVDADDNQIPVKNSEVVKELLDVAKMRVQGNIKLMEKEIEAFEIH